LVYGTNQNKTKQKQTKRYKQNKSNMSDTTKRYQSSLVDFMSFHHQTKYEKDTLFSDDVLGQLMPKDMYKWLCIKAFGIANPAPTDVPTKCRANTLSFHKKALSHFMINKTQCWNAITMAGNPTKSQEILTLIRRVKKQEVRRQGKLSFAKRPLTEIEFRTALTILSNKDDFCNRFRYPCMLKYQYHLVGRCDDLSHFLVKDIVAHTNPLFRPFCLETKVRWSKNVLEERDCPDQILLGSMDTDYCLLLSLSMYLEIWFSINKKGREAIFLFSDDIDTDKASLCTKQTYSRILQKEVFKNEDFYRLTNSNRESQLGSHSIRKFAASWARSNGCSSDDVDIRGRWKRNSGRIVERYIDVKQQYIDAKVEKSLCIGGPIRYSLLADCGVTSDFLYLYVVPGISSIFSGITSDNSMADVLSLPLLYAALDGVLSARLPAELVNRIFVAYNEIRVLPIDINPVIKVPLIIHRLNDQLCIDSTVSGSILVDGVANENVEKSGTNNFNLDNDYFEGLVIQQQHIRQQIASLNSEINSTIEHLRTSVNNDMKTLNRNINRISVQPPRIATQQQRQQAEFQQEIVDNRSIVKLCSCPKSLFDLWQEYTVGIGGGKPAKEYTPRERGANKINYCRRKSFWDVISKHTNAGYLACVAIDRVYDCYGNGLSVTKILNQMMKDKKNGGHPNLRI
jgi:hypothetical protein